MKPLKVYACYHTDTEVRMGSSSGAVFSSLAEYVFDQQGVVYGVAMSEDCYFAEFISVTDRERLSKLRGSKYLQARVGDSYKQVRNDLLSGKMVLFTGTGCQINGLKNFLGKEYDNLICVDVICHGVPSPALWEKYVRYLERKTGGKLKNINFRCKDDSWIDFGMKEVLSDKQQEPDQKLYISKDKDPYMQMFLRDYCLRPSCYACVAKKQKMSDLTIGDFWGISDVAPEMNDGKGTSLVLVRTEKGRRIFEGMSRGLLRKEVSYKKGVQYNPAEYRSCVRPLERDTFFNDMIVHDYEKLEKKYIVPTVASLVGKIKRKVKNTVKPALRLFRGGAKK